MRTAFTLPKLALMFAVPHTLAFAFFPAWLGRLKAEFGQRIVFWGGGVDTQKTLPFGTPEQVRVQVIERLRAFSPGGGFVFNTIHNIQARTPVANIVAMCDAVRDFNRG